MNVWSGEEGYPALDGYEFNVRAFDPDNYDRDTEEGDFAETQLLLTTETGDIASIEVGPQSEVLCDNEEGIVSYDITIHRASCSEGEFSVLLGLYSTPMEGVTNWFEVEGQEEADGFFFNFPAGESELHVVMQVYNEQGVFAGQGELPLFVVANQSEVEFPLDDRYEFKEAVLPYRTKIGNVGKVEIVSQEGTMCEGGTGDVYYEVAIHRSSCSAADFQVQLEVLSEMPEGVAYAFTTEHPWVYDFGPEDEVIYATMNVWSGEEGYPALDGYEFNVRAFDPDNYDRDTEEGDFAESRINLFTVDCSPSASKSVTITNSAEPEILVEDPIVNVKAYPNPFEDFIIFEFKAPYDTGVRLEIFNVLGEKIDDVFNGRIDANSLNSINYIPEIIPDQLNIYRMTIGVEVHTGILIHQD